MMDACSECKRSEFPVHAAALSGHLNCLKESLSELENPELLLDEDLSTPLHSAASAGQPDILKYLIENTRIPVRAKNKTGETCGHVAAQGGRLDCLKLLLGGPLKRAQTLAFEKDETGCSLLHSAVIANDNDVALWLLQRFGKDIANMANHDEVLPLHVASAQGNIEFIRIATKYDVYMVNRRDRNGATAAFYSVQGGYLQCLKYLVDKARADVHAVTRRGQSLLHAACLNGHVLIAQWLLGKMERNAMLSQTNDAATAIHCAASVSYTDRHWRSERAQTNGSSASGFTSRSQRTEALHEREWILRDCSRQGIIRKLRHLLKHHLSKFSSKKERKPKTLSTSGYSSTAPPPSADGMSYARISLSVPTGHGVSLVPQPSSGYGSSPEATLHTFIPRPEPGNHLVNWRGRIASVQESENSLALNHENWLLKRKSDKQREARHKSHSGTGKDMIASKSPHGKQTSPVHKQTKISQTAKHGGTKQKPLALDPPVKSMRRFVDCSMQTDPDPLLDNVVVVDNQERVLWSSDPGRKLEAAPTASAIVHAAQDQSEDVIFLGAESENEDGASQGTLDNGKRVTEKAPREKVEPNKARLMKVRYAPTPSPITEKREQQQRQKDQAKNVKKRSSSPAVTAGTQGSRSLPVAQERKQMTDNEAKNAGIAAAAEIDKILDNEIDSDHRDHS